jgi:hypothetical protein
MTTKPEADDLAERVMQFQSKHIGTNFLVHDLWRALTQTRFQRDGLIERIRAVEEFSTGKAAFDVDAERRRQIDVEGFDALHDDQWTLGELVEAAIAYLAYLGDDAATETTPPECWPWDPSWWKPSPDPRRDLVKAAALIIAEIERLDRMRPRDAL